MFKSEKDARIIGKIVLEKLTDNALELASQSKDTRPQVEAILMLNNLISAKKGAK